MTDWPERLDEVRLRGLEVVDEALDGMWLVLVVDMVDVDGVRRDKGAAWLLFCCDAVDWVEVCE